MSGVRIARRARQQFALPRDPPLPSESAQEPLPGRAHHPAAVAPDLQRAPSTGGRSSPGHWVTAHVTWWVLPLGHVSTGRRRQRWSGHSLRTPVLAQSLSRPDTTDGAAGSTPSAEPGPQPRPREVRQMRQVPIPGSVGHLRLRPVPSPLRQTAQRSAAARSPLLPRNRF